MVVSSVLSVALAAAEQGVSVRPWLRVGVIGSRGFSDLALVREFVAALPFGCVLVSGGAPGVDQVAAAAWRARGLQPVIFPFVSRLGRAGGPARNAELVKSCSLVVAFHDGRSTGTANAIALARHFGVACFVIGQPPAPGQPAQAPLF